MGKLLLGRRLALPGSMGHSAFAHIIQLLECPGEICGPHSEFFFFLNRMESVALTKPVPFKPFLSADTLKACALIGPLDSRR